MFVTIQLKHQLIHVELKQNTTIKTFERISWIQNITFIYNDTEKGKPLITKVTKLNSLRFDGECVKYE